MNKTTAYKKISRGVCIIKDKILLAKATHKKNYFLPGGHILKNENPSDALLREIDEEIGEKVQIDEFLGVIRNSWEIPDRVINELNYLFTLTMMLEDDEQIKSKESHLLFEWVALDAFDKIYIEPKCLKDEVLKYLNSKYAS